MKYLLTILIAVFLVGFHAITAEAQDISLSAGLDKTEMPYEETAALTIEVKWPGDITHYRFGILPLPKTENLKVLGTTSTISSIEEEGKEFTVRTFKYSFKPTKAGIGIIRPILLNYITMPDSLPGDLSTQEFQVSIAQPIPVVEKKGFPIFYIVIIIAFVIVGLTLLILFLIFRKKGDVAPVLTPVQGLIDELATIKKDAGIDRKLFYTKLYRALVNYLSAAYKVETINKAPEEICEAVKSLKAPAGFNEKMTGWLIQADKEKFAPGSGTPGDTVRLANEIENYFQKTDTTDTKSEVQ
jgi:hypothetical protein